MFFVRFQVITNPGVSGWLEPVPPLMQWLKEMKTVFVEHEANVKCCFVHTGCVSTILRFFYTENPVWKSVTISNLFNSIDNK